LSKSAGIVVRFEVLRLKIVQRQAEEEMLNGRVFVEPFLKLASID
jgi:hypothetical protein